ncbi:MAG: hypothetical protein PHC43_01070 [Candidatus Marinimicrobia bacterium]|jgi:hypothetical protein|nr:hypothetical protein [Candidatus Neomarinimicrobiota bacterium]MDD5229900.1 hypothetical protein [Candidatus Neomarinimicrobiota bacterium]
MIPKPKNEILKLIDSAILQHIIAYHSQSQMPLGLVYIETIFYGMNGVFPEFIGALPSGKYAWVTFFTIEDSVGDNVKINGQWFRREDVIFYDEQYKAKKLEIEARLRPAPTPGAGGANPV